MRRLNNIWTHSAPLGRGKRDLAKPDYMAKDTSEQPEEEEYDFGWMESFWYFWASFIQLGADRSPKSMEGKLLASG